MLMCKRHGEWSSTAPGHVFTCALKAVGKLWEGTFIIALDRIIRKRNQILCRSAQVESQSCARLSCFLYQLKSVKWPSACDRSIFCFDSFIYFYLFKFYVPVPANIKHVDIAMVITGEKCLSASVKRHLEETDCLTLVTSCAANYRQQDPDGGNNSGKTVVAVL